MSASLLAALFNPVICSSAIAGQLEKPVALQDSILIRKLSGTSHQAVALSASDSPNKLFFYYQPPSKKSLSLLYVRRGWKAESPIGHSPQ